MEEFDSLTTSKNLLSQYFKHWGEVLLCKQNNVELHHKKIVGNRSIEDDSCYKDNEPFDPEEKQNWIHICAAIETSTQYEETKFSQNNKL